MLVESKGIVNDNFFLISKGIVNDNDSPKRKIWAWGHNNRESLRMEAQLKFVNTNK